MSLFLVDHPLDIAVGLADGVAQGAADMRAGGGPVGGRIAGQLAVVAAIEIDCIQAGTVAHVSLGDIVVGHAVDDALVVDPGGLGDIGVL